MCTEFRKLGHEAYSCDILPCSGGHPEWHIQDDVLKHLDGWDMIIAFPPCTHLAVSGARHFEKKREDGRQRKSIEFFCKFLDLPCKYVSIENPINIISGNYIKKWFPDIAEKYNLPRKPTQIIQPYYFGHHMSKATCLWLKGLPMLVPTCIVDPGKSDEYGFTIGGPLQMARDENGKIISWNDPRTAIARSKTFTGIAKAMAKQWGGKI